MGKVTKAQSYAIRWLDKENMEAKQIASELNLTIKQVKAFLEKHTQTNPDIATKTQKVNKTKNLIKNKTTSGKEGVTMMTGEASQVIDEQKKKRCSVRDLSSCIHRPNGPN